MSETNDKELPRGPHVPIYTSIAETAPDGPRPNRIYHAGAKETVFSGKVPTLMGELKWVARNILGKKNASLNSREASHLFHIIGALLTEEIGKLEDPESKEAKDLRGKHVAAISTADKIGLDEEQVLAENLKALGGLGRRGLETTVSEGKRLIASIPGVEADIADLAGRNLEEIFLEPKQG